MNAVEIEEAISELASQPFNQEEFAYDFLAAFGRARAIRNNSRRTTIYPSMHDTVVPLVIPIRILNSDKRSR